MKKITTTFVSLFFLMNCAIAQDLDCNRTALFGESEICLPLIEGYQECYLDPLIMELADATEVQSNVILGFYLSNETYAKKSHLGLFGFDDYFKIYGTKHVKNTEASQKLLHRMKDVVARNFISKDWELLEKEVDKIVLEVETRVPTVIKSYSENENSFTYVVLTKYDVGGAQPLVVANTINGLLVNNRLVWMAYYLNYKGEETIARLQKNSNAILSKF